MRIVTVPIFLMLNLAMITLAQTSDARPDQELSTSLAATLRTMHSNIARNLAEAAAAMPEEHFDFKPTPQVRTFAQIVAHVTMTNRLFCSAAKGESLQIRETTESLSKEGALKSLLDSLALCDSVYKDTTDSNFGDSAAITGPGNKATPTTRGAILIFNTSHNTEHYGNIVVYLRLNGIIPPSTARVQSERR